MKVYDKSFAYDKKLFVKRALYLLKQDGTVDQWKCYVEYLSEI